MRYSIERSLEADRDLDRIFDFVFESYVQFGDAPAQAFDRAAARVRRIEGAMRALGKAPHQGTLRNDLMAGLRCVTKDRAVFYFTIDEERPVVRVLAVFFGGQDHQRAMLKRVMGEA